MADRQHDIHLTSPSGNKPNGFAHGMRLTLPFDGQEPLPKGMGMPESTGRTKRGGNGDQAVNSEHSPGHAFHAGHFKQASAAASSSAAGGGLVAGAIKSVAHAGASPASSAAVAAGPSASFHQDAASRSRQLPIARDNPGRPTSASGRAASSATVEAGTHLHSPALAPHNSSSGRLDGLNHHYQQQQLPYVAPAVISPRTSIGLSSTELSAYIPTASSRIGSPVHFSLSAAASASASAASAGGGSSGSSLASPAAAGPSSHAYAPAGANTAASGRAAQPRSDGTSQQQPPVSARRQSRSNSVSGTGAAAQPASSGSSVAASSPYLPAINEQQRRSSARGGSSLSSPQVAGSSLSSPPVAISTAASGSGSNEPPFFLGASATGAYPLSDSGKRGGSSSLIDAATAADLGHRYGPNVVLVPVAVPVPVHMSDDGTMVPVSASVLHQHQHQHQHQQQSHQQSHIPSHISSSNNSKSEASSSAAETSSTAAVPVGMTGALPGPKQHTASVATSSSGQTDGDQRQNRHTPAASSSSSSSSSLRPSSLSPISFASSSSNVQSGVTSTLASPARQQLMSGGASLAPVTSPLAAHAGMQLYAYHAASADATAAAAAGPRIAPLPPSRPGSAGSGQYATAAAAASFSAADASGNAVSAVRQKAAAAAAPLFAGSGDDSEVEEFSLSDLHSTINGAELKRSSRRDLPRDMMPQPSAAQGGDGQASAEDEGFSERVTAVILSMMASKAAAEDAISRGVPPPFGLHANAAAASMASGREGRGDEAGGSATRSRAHSSGVGVCEGVASLPSAAGPGSQNKAHPAILSAPPLVASPTASAAATSASQGRSVSAVSGGLGLPLLQYQQQQGGSTCGYLGNFSPGREGDAAAAGLARATVLGGDVQLLASAAAGGITGGGLSSANSSVPGFGAPQAPLSSSPWLQEFAATMGSSSSSSSSSSSGLLQPQSSPVAMQSRVGGGGICLDTSLASAPEPLPSQKLSVSSHGQPQPSPSQLTGRPSKETITLQGYLSPLTPTSAAIAAAASSTTATVVVQTPSSRSSSTVGTGTVISDGDAGSSRHSILAAGGYGDPFSVVSGTAQSTPTSQGGNRLSHSSNGFTHGTPSGGVSAAEIAGRPILAAPSPPVSARGSGSNAFSFSGYGAGSPSDLYLQRAVSTSPLPSISSIAASGIASAGAGGGSTTAGGGSGAAPSHGGRPRIVSGSAAYYDSTVAAQHQSHQQPSAVPAVSSSLTTPRSAAVGAAPSAGVSGSSGGTGAGSGGPLTSPSRPPLAPQSSARDRSSSVGAPPPAGGGHANHNYHLYAQQQQYHHYVSHHHDAQAAPPSSVAIATSASGIAQGAASYGFHVSPSTASHHQQQPQQRHSPSFGPVAVFPPSVGPSCTAADDDDALEGHSSFVFGRPKGLGLASVLGLALPSDVRLGYGTLASISESGGSDGGSLYTCGSDSGSDTARSLPHQEYNRAGFGRAADGRASAASGVAGAAGIVVADGVADALDSAPSDSHGFRVRISLLSTLSSSTDASLSGERDTGGNDGVVAMTVRGAPAVSAAAGGGATSSSGASVGGRSRRRSIAGDATDVSSGSEAESDGAGGSDQPVALQPQATSIASSGDQPQAQQHHHHPVLGQLGQLQLGLVMSNVQSISRNGSADNTPTAISERSSRRSGGLSLTFNGGGSSSNGGTPTAAQGVSSTTPSSSSSQKQLQHQLQHRSPASPPLIARPGGAASTAGGSGMLDPLNWGPPLPQPQFGSAQPPSRNDSGGSGPGGYFPPSGLGLGAKLGLSLSTGTAGGGASSGTAASDVRTASASPSMAFAAAATPGGSSQYSRLSSSRPGSSNSGMIGGGGTPQAAGAGTRVTPGLGLGLHLGLDPGLFQPNQSDLSAFYDDDGDDEWGFGDEDDDTNAHGDEEAESGRKGGAVRTPLQRTRDGGGSGGSLRQQGRHHTHNSVQMQTPWRDVEGTPARDVPQSVPQQQQQLSFSRNVNSPGGGGGGGVFSPTPQRPTASSRAAEISTSHTLQSPVPVNSNSRRARAMSEAGGRYAVTSELSAMTSDVVGNELQRPPQSTFPTSGSAAEQLASSSSSAAAVAGASQSRRSGETPARASSTTSRSRQQKRGGTSGKIRMSANGTMNLEGFVITEAGIQSGPAPLPLLVPPEVPDVIVDSAPHGSDGGDKQQQAGAETAAALPSTTSSRPRHGSGASLGSLTNVIDGADSAGGGAGGGGRYSNEVSPSTPTHAQQGPASKRWMSRSAPTTPASPFYAAEQILMTSSASPAPGVTLSSASTSAAAIASSTGIVAAPLSALSPQASPANRLLFSSGSAASMASAAGSSVMSPLPRRGASSSSTTTAAAASSAPRPLFRDSSVRIDIIGKGASGTVYKTVHVPTLTLVAAKTIPVYNDERRHGLAKELKALWTNRTPFGVPSSDPSAGIISAGGSPYTVKAPCPYIVSFYDAFTDHTEGTLTFVLEYMDGGSLEEIVNTGGCASESVLANVSYRCLKGFEFLHARGLIHRDVKPANLLINHLGEVKLSDFGVICDTASIAEDGDDGDEGPDLGHTFVGTMTYMSPERIAGQRYSYASDIWSFGLTILTTALGRFPLDTDGGYWGLLNMLQDESVPLPSPPPDRFSPQFIDFIALCLKRDPAQRPTAAELTRHPWITKHVNVNPDVTGIGGAQSGVFVPDESQKDNEGSKDDLRELAYKVQKYRCRSAIRRQDPHRRLPLIPPERFQALAHQMGLPATAVAQAFNREQRHYDKQLKHMRNLARLQLDESAQANAAPAPAAAASSTAAAPGANGSGSGQQRAQMLLSPAATIASSSAAPAEPSDEDDYSADDVIADKAASRSNGKEATFSAMSSARASPTLPAAPQAPHHHHGSSSISSSSNSPAPLRQTGTGTASPRHWQQRPQPSAESRVTPPTAVASSSLAMAAAAGAGNGSTNASPQRNSAVGRQLQFSSRTGQQPTD